MVPVEMDHDGDVHPFFLSQAKWVDATTRTRKSRPGMPAEGPPKTHPALVSRGTHRAFTTGQCRVAPACASPMRGGGQRDAGQVRLR